MLKPTLQIDTSEKENKTKPMNQEMVMLLKYFLERRGITYSHYEREKQKYESKPNFDLRKVWIVRFEL